MQSGKYVNGVKIGDWFFSWQEKWLHFHKYAATQKWRMCSDLVCETCKQEVPKAVRTHAKLQKLTPPNKSEVLATWPVHAD